MINRLVLNLGKGIYFVALAVAACSVVTAFFAAIADMGLLSSACLLIGLTALAWLGYYWQRLLKYIDTILSVPAKNQPDYIKQCCGFSHDLLSQKLNLFLDSCCQQSNQLQQELKDIQLRLQLSQRQRKNLEAIIYSIHDAVIVTDDFAKLLMANKPAGELFGFDVNSAHGKSVSELIDKPQFVDFLEQSKKSRTRHAKCEIEFTGAPCPKVFDCIVSCIHDDNDRISGVVAVLHEITREKEISRMKNEFVSHVSHELKTPLASITAYAEMLVEGEAEDNQTRQEFLAVIQTQAQRLNRLIDDILNISRIESGLTKVNKQQISLTLLIREAVQMMKSYAAEKSIQLIEQAPIVFDQVYADRDMVLQVLINLLSNAVKYTPQGGSVRIQSEVNEADGLVRVTVTDNGVGIPEEEIGRIFEKFYRVGANSKCADGTGLGLNLVKQIVEKVHNGRVFVTSKQGVGSTFGFEMPLGLEQPAPV